MTLTDEEIVRNLVLITARKADYLHALLRGPLAREAAFRPVEKRNLHAGLIRAIAGLEPTLFVSPEEAKRKKLNPTNVLQNLDRDIIFEALEQGLLLT